MNSLRILSAIPLSQPAAHCSVCDKLQARWAVRGTDPVVSICSMCVLYRSKWGEDNKPAIQKCLAGLVRARAEVFQAQDGQLARCSDADDLVGVLVLVDRTATRMGQ